MIHNKIGSLIDIAIFYGSTHVMHDALFIKHFSEIKDSGIKSIIDFHAGCVLMKRAISSMGRSFINKTLGQNISVDLVEKYNFKFIKK